MRNVHLPAPQMFLTAALAAMVGFTVRGDEGGQSQADVRFNVIWHDCAKACAKLKDDYLVVPSYAPDCDSSRGMTRIAVKKQLTRTCTRHEGLLVTTSVLSPSDEDLRAADALPSVAAGEYGWVHSVKVVAVIGPDEVSVRDVWLADKRADASDKSKFIAEKTAEAAAAEKDLEKKADATAKATAGISVDAGGRLKKVQNSDQKAEANKIKAQARKNLQDEKKAIKEVAEARWKGRLDAADCQGKHKKDLAKTFRLVGFPTAGLKPGGRWAGPDGKGLQIAVAWTGADPVLAAVGMLEKHSLNQEGFAALLSKRKISKADFADKAVKAKRADQNHFAVKVLPDLVRKGLEK